MFSACASEQKLSSSEKEYKISKPLTSFFSEFELATINHDKEKIVSLLDKNYKKERYAGLSKHEKEYFFREFYCGTDVKTQRITCPAFGELDRIDFISVQQNSIGGYTVRYKIKTIYEVLEKDWIITVEKSSLVPSYGIKPTYN